MDIAKWIEENTFEIDDCGGLVSVDDLKELLKTHTLVPNEPVAVVEVWNQGGSGEFVTASGIEALPHGTKLYTHNNC